MGKKTDIRWKQRFQNFENAYFLLKKSVLMKKISEVERAGIIQIFEFTLELGWKTLKDYLESKNVQAKFPRDVIKQAFKYGLIENGDLWLDMLDKRNLLSHTYDEKKSKLAYRLIMKQYFKAIENVYKKLKSELK